MLRSSAFARVADGAPELEIQLAAIQDYLLRVEGLDDRQGTEKSPAFST
jgi:hypothetical protein